MHKRPLIAILVASIIGGLAMQTVNMGTIPWAVSRAAGLGAFAVLSAAMILGLLISTKAGDGVLSRPFVFQMHQFMAVVSLALIALHAGSLLFDGFFRFTPLSLVVPFTAPYSPIAVGAGVIAGWLAAITTASYWMRSRIGQKRWRSLHYLTFVAYLASLGHAVAAGSDSHMPVIYWSYVVSVAAVLAFTTLRITGYEEQRRSRTGSGRQPSSTPAPVVTEGLQGR